MKVHPRLRISLAATARWPGIGDHLPFVPSVRTVREIKADSAWRGKK